MRNKSSWFLAALCVLPMLSGMTVFADERDMSDQIVRYEKIDGGVRIVGANEGLTKVVINKTIDGYPILEIGEGAFENCVNLEEVEIADGVQVIGKDAFSGCISLKSLRLPNTLTSIGEGAFYYCGGLTELTLPESLTEIGTVAFGYCISLTELTIPSSITALAPYTFYRDLALQTVHLPEGLTEIGNTCFMECYSLEQLDIPASVTNIGQIAVLGAPALKAVHVAEGNPNYYNDEDGILYDSTGKTLLLYPGGRENSEVTVRDGVELIAPYAFSYAYSLTDIRLPESVKEIGAGAFSDCKALRTLMLPAAVTEISGSMLANCTALTEFPIPSTVSTIGKYAFFGCTSLLSMEIPDTVTAIGEEAFGLYVNEETGETEAIEGFVLSGSADSPASAYAKEQGVPFEQHGFDKHKLLSAALAVLAVAVVAAVIVLLVRGQKNKPETETAEQTSEPETDPNYQSILADDDDEDGDPYDRSYGFATEAVRPEEPDDAAEDADSTSGETDA